MSLLASRQYRPARYRKTPVPSARTRHVLNRFTAGYTPALARQVKARGGIDRWFADQLVPARFKDPWYTTSRDWWPSNAASTAQLWRWHQSGTTGLSATAQNYQRWALARRVGSQRQVLESVAAFWEDHLHVPATGEPPAMFRSRYGQMIRTRALGRYADLLVAAITHPAMGCYLDNAKSTRKAPNENLGRELLELHTVGRAAGYTEEDVKASARILTGWRVEVWGTWAATYSPKDHWTGPVRVLGFSHPNADPDGREVTRAYLTYLARHPATAQRIARKLAVRYVSDTPSQALVDRLARTYLRHDTAIAPVLRDLVASTEFAASADRKVRTPEEEVVATYRALGVKLLRPTRSSSAANAILWQCAEVGLAPFEWPRPDGRPDSADAWTSTSRILASLDLHLKMGGGWWPRTDVRHRPSRAFIPQRRMRFDQLVDHLSRSLLGRLSSARMLKACCQATGQRPSDIVTRDWPEWRLKPLLAAVLDTPEHMSR